MKVQCSQACLHHAIRLWLTLLVMCSLPMCHVDAADHVISGGEGFHRHQNKLEYTFSLQDLIHGLVSGIPDIDLCLVECLLRDDMCWTAFLDPSTTICWLFDFDYGMNGAYIDAPSLKNTVCTKCMYLLVFRQELFMSSLQTSQGNTFKLNILIYFRVQCFMSHDDDSSRSTTVEFMHKNVLTIISAQNHTLENKFLIDNSMKNALFNLVAH